MTVLAKQRRASSLNFAISKADKHLDHLGCAASNAFLNIEHDFMKHSSCLTHMIAYSL